MDMEPILDEQKHAVLHAFCRWENCHEGQKANGWATTPTKVQGYPDVDKFAKVSLVCLDYLIMREGVEGYEYHITEKGREYCKTHPFRWWEAGRSA